MGVCALERGEAKVDGAEAAQGGVDRGVGVPDEGMARSYGLLSREAGGVGHGPGFEGFCIDYTPVPEEVRAGPSQYQTAKAFVPKWQGNETP